MTDGGPALDREALARLIPHAGAMCLLDRVEHWTPQRIVGRAVSHRDPDNPLRHEGRLAAVNGIEYAAQAMAVHGALVEAGGADSEPRPGFLATARDVSLSVERLDDLDEDLMVYCDRLMGDRAGMMYGFEVAAGGRVLLGGRAMVMFREGE